MQRCVFLLFILFSLVVTLNGAVQQEADQNPERGSFLPEGRPLETIETADQEEIDADEEKAEEERNAKGSGSVCSHTPVLSLSVFLLRLLTI